MRIIAALIVGFFAGIVATILCLILVTERTENEGGKHGREQDK